MVTTSALTAQERASRLLACPVPPQVSSQAHNSSTMHQHNGTHVLRPCVMAGAEQATRHTIGPV